MTDASDALRRLTVEALEEALPGLDEFRRAFESCSDAFEMGDDSEAFAAIGAVVPRLREFVEFSHHLLVNVGEFLDPQSVRDLVELNRDLETALGRMLSDTQAGDLTALADTLRLDMCETMDRYAELFPELARRMHSVTAVSSP